MGGRRRQESIRGSAPGLWRPEGGGDAGSGAREGGCGTSTRCRGHLALVLRVDGLAASLFRSLTTLAARVDEAPRQEELAGPERRPRWSSPRAGVVTASGAKLEDEAAALPPALFPFRSLPTPAAQGDDPGEFTAPATRTMGAAGATRSCDRHLVGPIIPAAAPLVVAVAPLLVTLARGGAFAVGGAIHAAPGPGAEVPEGLDGEEITLHQLKMEGEPLHQAVDPGERLPPAAKTHHAGGSGFDVDSHATDPAAPHAQSQRLVLFRLQDVRQRSREAEATARRPAQPDDERAGVVREMNRREKQSRRRRRGRRAAPPASSASAPSTASSTTSPPPPSPYGWLRHHGCKGRRGALPGSNPCRHRRRTRVPFLHDSWGEGTRDLREERRKECGPSSPPSAPYKGAEWGLGRPAQPIKAEEGQATGPTLYFDPRLPGSLPPPPPPQAEGGGVAGEQGRGNR